jgi:type I restriction enzyme S subunit
MSEWRTEAVGHCLATLPLARTGKLQARDYQPTGLYPIVDQGKELIAGWTNSDNGLITTGLPVVVFGDHTRVLKYIDFPFVRGADGTQILKPKAHIDPLFFYYACRSLDLPSRGYNRHFKSLKEKEISIPPIEEQLEMAAALRSLEEAAKLQDEALHIVRAAKAAAMRTLFAHGLQEEKQKETHVGPVPLSWGMHSVGEFAHRMQYGLSMRGEESGQYPIFRMNCQQDGKVHLRNLQYVTIDEKTAAAYRVKSGDILFNRTNSYELVGRTAIVEIETDAVFASYLVRISVDEERIDPRFLNHFLNWDRAQTELKRLASRGVSQANISASKLRDFLIPVPDITEQRDIVAILDAIDRKTSVHRQKHILFDSLFQSVLHKLLSGEICPDDLNLSALDPINRTAVAR